MLNETNIQLLFSDLSNSFFYKQYSKIEIENLNKAVAGKIINNAHGHLKKWIEIIKKLPAIESTHVVCNEDCVQLVSTKQIKAGYIAQIEAILRTFSPWRQGPFKFFDIHVDTEWQSFYKWQRFKSAKISLQGKHILDVGCGSSYFMWRMLGEGAKEVIGIDPSQLGLMQFNSVKRYTRNYRAFMLPFRLEELPLKPKSFDFVFSMGVLYHRKAPIMHLKIIHNFLNKHGGLILETLVLSENKYIKENSLVPNNNRYAGMPNVWEVPSIEKIKKWLKEAGFIDITLINLSNTTIHEQRKTDWIDSYSLSDFLDPFDSSLTIEGYPAPKRAMIYARKVSFPT